MYVRFCSRLYGLSDTASVSAPLSGNGRKTMAIVRNIGVEEFPPGEIIK